MAIMKFAKIITGNLFKKPATRLYPLTKKEFYANTRGRIVIDSDPCVYCGLCQRKCPTGAIAVKFQDKIWTIDAFSCITCGYCVEICPKKCLHMEGQYTTPDVEMWEETFQDRELPEPTEHYWD